MSKANKISEPKYFKPVFTAILAALIVLLTFTIGSVRIGPITLTFNCLPVAVGAVFLGPLYGAILGLVFGLSSFFASFTSASLTTVLLSINPFYVFLMCVVPRVLCGWLPGLIFKALPKSTKPKRLASSAVCCTLTTVFNTIGFMSLMWVFFSGDFSTNQTVINKVSGATNGTVISNIFLLFFFLAGLNAVFEVLMNLVFGTAICRALFAVIKRK